MSVQVLEYLPTITETEGIREHPRSKVLILPWHILSDSDKVSPRYDAEAIILRKVLRAGGLSADTLTELGNCTEFVDNHSSAWIGPTLLLSLELSRQKSDVISAVSGIVSNYLYEKFRGLGRKPLVRLEVACETTGEGNFKKITYDGDVAGLHELKRAIEGVFSEDDTQAVIAQFDS